MQNPNKYVEQLIKPQLLLIGAMVAVGAAALKLDQSVGGRELLNRTTDVPEPIVRTKEGATKTAIVFLGLGMNETETADTVEPLLADDCNLMIPAYPELGFPVNEIFDGMYKSLAELNSECIYMAGPSNGGNLECDFIEHGYQNGWEEIADRIRGMALDGTPTGKKDIKLMPRIVLWAAGRSEKSWFVEHNKSRFMKHHRGLAKIPLSATVAQGRYMYGEHSSLTRSPERVVWLRGIQDDRVVKETSAIQSMEQRLGRPIEVKIDEFRKPMHTDTSRRGFGLILQEFGILRTEQPQVPQLELQAVA